MRRPHSFVLGKAQEEDTGTTTIVWIEKNAIVSAILQDLFYLSTACSHYKRSRSVVDKKIETRAVQSVTQVLYILKIFFQFRILYTYLIANMIEAY